ncbi:MAG: DUF1700 domain-containing protein [Bacillota bacterium]|nr:DUF1700 domain-containing protein [Bacillota bacterium]
MTRESYLKELSKHLKKLPKQDFDDAMNHFQECFDEVGAEGEADLMKEWGSPENLAGETIANLLNQELGGRELIDTLELESGPKTKKDKSLKKIMLLSALCILAAPIGLPLTIAIFAMFFSAIIVIFSLLFALACACIAAFAMTAKLLVAAVLVFSTSSSAALILIGMGILGISAALLFAVLIAYLYQSVLYLSQKISTKMRDKRRKHYEKTA